MNELIHEELIEIKTSKVIRTCLFCVYVQFLNRSYDLHCIVKCSFVNFFFFGVNRLPYINTW